MSEGTELLADSPARKPRTPAWALRAPEALLSQVNELMEVLDLCMRGIGTATTVPLAIRTLDKAQGRLGSQAATERHAHAEKLARLAQREIDSDFSILHAQATVSLWSGLESMVKDITRDWVLNKPEIVQGSPWSKIKVRIGEYMLLDNEQRAEHLVELVDQTTAGPLKLGITRFERLLETVGLAGGAADPMPQRLFELQQIRNVLVHRQGNADQRFCRACPWTGFKDGQRVHIDSKRFESYYSAVLAYTTELICRTGERFGVDMREGLDSNKSSVPSGPPTEEPIDTTHLNKNL